MRLLGTATFGVIVSSWELLNQQRFRGNQMLALILGVSLLLVADNGRKISRTPLLNYSCFNSSPQVDTADPPFPRPTGFWWFGCQGAMNGRGGNQRNPHQHPLSRPQSGPEEGDQVLDAGEYPGLVLTPEMAAQPDPSWWWWDFHRPPLASYQNLPPPTPSADCSE